MAHGAMTCISGGGGLAQTRDRATVGELHRRSTLDGCTGAAAGVLRPGRASSAAARPRIGAQVPSWACSTATTVTPRVFKTLNIKY